MLAAVLFCSEVAKVVVAPLLLLFLSEEIQNVQLHLQELVSRMERFSVVVSVSWPFDHRATSYVALD